MPSLTPNNLFANLQQELNTISLPDGQWFSAMELNTYVGFYRISQNLQTLTAVIFDVNLECKVYSEGVPVDVQINRPTTLKNFEEIFCFSKVKMKSTNMLSANKVKLHGMTSTKWTTQDKITQYKGLIKLYTRDKKIIDMDTIVAQKKQSKELKNLQKEIELNRRELDNSIRGDKQKLRNTLAEHREMQMAFQNSQPQKVIDMVHQLNFNKRKTRDILKYRMKLKSEKLIDLKLRYAEYEDRLKYEGISWQSMLPCERQAHIITGKVQDAILKKEAAIYIRNSYKEMIAIMKRDALYFDAILVSIRNDGINQGKCMINATTLGQLGTEYLDDRRQEFQYLEKIVKRDMISRKTDLADVQRNVETFAQNLRNLIRRDSDINLGRVVLEKTESFEELTEELTSVENTLKYLKNSIFTPTIESIFPCIKEQRAQKERLKSFVEKCEKNKETLLKRNNHAALMSSQLQYTMIETTSQYTSDKKLLNQNISEEQEHVNELTKLTKSRYTLLADVRISLRHLVLLSKLCSSSTAPDPQVHIIVSKKVLVEPPSVDELDNNKVIPQLITTFTKLVANAKEALTGSEIEDGYKMFEQMMQERTKREEIFQVISEESLIEAVFMDSHILTREDIKKQSAEIVAINAAADDLAPAVPFGKKKTGAKK